ADIDDDNDGILDVDECIGGNYVQTATNLRHFSNEANAAGNPGATYASNPPSTYPGSSSRLLLQFPEVLPIGTQVSVFVGADPAVSSTDMQIQRTNAAETSYVRITDVNIPSGSIHEVTFTVSGSSLQYIRIEAW